MWLKPPNFCNLKVCDIEAKCMHFHISQKKKKFNNHAIINKNLKEWLLSKAHYYEIVKYIKINQNKHHNKSEDLLLENKWKLWKIIQSNNQNW